MQDELNATAQVLAAMGCDHDFMDQLKIKGRFSIQCYESDGGPLLWSEEFDNVVDTLGKNTLLDAGLAGSSYTVTGPFMGLISSTSYSAVVAGDTAASHAGWLEAGSANAPTFAARLTMAWAAASGGAKALSSGLAFTMTGSGTVQGACVFFGSGAVATIASTAGVLFSAGVFGTAQPVISGNVVTVSYSVSI